MDEFNYQCTPSQKDRLDTFVQWLQRNKKVNTSEAEYEVSLLLRLASVQQDCNVSKTILDITDARDKSLPRMKMTWTCCKEAKYAFPQELRDLNRCMRDYVEFLAADQRSLSIPSTAATTVKKVGQSLFLCGR